MSAPAPTETADAPAAVAAFARGVERRGAVLAELQAGDADAGDAALAVALAEFGHRAGGLPLAQWPQLFWSTLLAQPALRTRQPAGDDPWTQLGGGPRAALLLRLAAGLGEAEAAQALGVSVAAYRLALQHAVPHGDTGEPDAQAWQALRDQVHRRIKTLPPERAQHLARRREQALAGAPAAAPTTAELPPRGSRRLLQWLRGLLGLCVVAFAATFWWPQAGDTVASDRHSARLEPLRPASRPAARYRAEAAALTHRDFGLVADAAAAPLVRDLEFYSWLAAQLTAGPAGALDMTRIDATVPTPADPGAATGNETADAPL